MSKLLQTVLTNPSARTTTALPAALAEASNNYQPWGSVAPQ